MGIVLVKTAANDVEAEKKHFEEMLAQGRVI